MTKMLETEMVPARNPVVLPKIMYILHTIVRLPYTVTPKTSTVSPIRFTTPLKMPPLTTMVYALMFSGALGQTKLVPGSIIIVLAPVQYDRGGQSNIKGNEQLPPYIF